jgi:nucleoside-diphosphate-sugar epimerase
MVIILGLGFTGQRLARRLLRGGLQTYAAVRNVERFRDLSDAGLILSELKPGSVEYSLPARAILVDLIPPLAEPENTALRAMIHDLKPRRVVYVSSTGVYGGQVEVNAKTPVQPNDERGRRRWEEERWVVSGSSSGRWTSLILRAAAIYGPHRGVHAAIREGKMPRSAGSGIVSRIHVEDLATIIQAGIFFPLEGAWPVADDAPCSSAEIAAWCNHSTISGGTIVGGTIAGRRVDGTEIREKLGIRLAYPSWRTGIPASIAEENGEP